MNKGLLHPSLRNVVEQHIVPTHRCRMLRYRLSLVCRELWYRLRDEGFIVFAQVVSGHVCLSDSLRERPDFVTECLRFIWPAYPAPWYACYGVRKACATRWYPLADGREAAFGSTMEIRFSSEQTLHQSFFGYLDNAIPCSCGHCTLKRTVYRWKSLWDHKSKEYVLSLQYWDYRGEKKK